MELVLLTMFVSVFQIGVLVWKCLVEIVLSVTATMPGPGSISLVLMAVFIDMLNVVERVCVIATQVFVTVLKAMRAMLVNEEPVLMIAVDMVVASL
mmetsp:Transcript_29500/g.54600  ORF Transcript_29500/g.54600 Transcript_29500/m.54600 type:complete len:96 (+) Transcript_29500:157-444(+)